MNRWPKLKIVANNSFANTTITNRQKRINDTFRRRQHVTTQEARHRPAGICHGDITNSINGAIHMLATIELNDKTQFNACKIGDIGANW